MVRYILSQSLQLQALPAPVETTNTNFYYYSN